MTFLKTFVLVTAPVLVALSAAPAATQTLQARQNLPFNGSACPTGYERGSARTPRENDTNICYDRRSDAQRSNVNVTKSDRLDRCPLGYYTSDADASLCTTRAPNPPSVRAKGSGPCRAGEVEDWGVWCVSNYGQITPGQAATGLRDWNAIYTLNRATPPRQADLPEGSEYTPAYITIFGRVNPEGSPIGAAAAPAVQASGPASDAAQTPTATNCPPAGNGAAQQAGAALGGLLGGRRGNAQAGAALGGLIGQAAGSAGRRPQGC